MMSNDGTPVNQDYDQPVTPAPDDDKLTDDDLARFREQTQIHRESTVSGVAGKLWDKINPFGRK
jgi:hypothetical protein